MWGFAKGPDCSDPWHSEHIGTDVPEEKRSAIRSLVRGVGNIPTQTKYKTGARSRTLRAVETEQTIFRRYIEIIRHLSRNVNLI